MYGNNPFWKFKQKLNEFYRYKDSSGAYRRLGGPSTDPPDDEAEQEKDEAFRKGREESHLETLRDRANRSHEEVSKLENHGIDLDQSRHAIDITDKDEADEHDITRVGTVTDKTHPTVKQHLDNITKLHTAVAGSFPKHIYDPY